MWIIPERKAGETMRHIPYGYRIENGRAVIDEEQVATVREFFQNYISGMALMPAAEIVGLKLYHGSAGRMLRNKKYLGDDYYPAIIDKETFDKAEEIRRSRAKALGRVWELEGKKDIIFPTSFSMSAVKKVSDDPFEQAAYAYSLIESEVDGDGTKYEYYCDPSQKAGRKYRCSWAASKAESRCLLPGLHGQ